MFARHISVKCLAADGSTRVCPIAWIDNFAMRNFTNDAIFDDTLPVGDGLMEIGNRVPLEKLQISMEDWFRRKGYIDRDESLRIRDC